MRALLLLALLPLALVIAGCTAPAADPPADAAVPPAPPSPDAPVVSRVNLTATGYVRGAGQEHIGAIERQGEFGHLRNASAALVEMAWEPATPASAELVLRVYNDGTLLGEASGPSPLRVTLEDPPGRVAAHFAPVGDPAVVPRQTVQMVLSAFDGAVPDGYTALP